MKIARQSADRQRFEPGYRQGIARRLAEEGARVVMNARRADVLEGAARDVSATGAEVLAVPASASSARGADELVARALARFGQVDVLVKNAALANPVAHFLEMTEEHWDQVIRSNLKSVYPMLPPHGAARVERGGGSIVNSSSFAAARSHRPMAAYDASKGGLEAGCAPWRSTWRPWTSG